MTKMLNTNEISGRKIDIEKVAVKFDRNVVVPSFLQRRRKRAERRLRRAL